MEPKIKCGVYRHYKGKKYLVLGIASHSETLEEMVVYVHLYESEDGHNHMWVRPLSMFLENVVVDGKEVPRFEFLGIH
ncbi:MAG: DUF1653 domain-containing protein [Candidatus Dojkabacteria bacterium]|nr:MAG: DUF1653 domain-containing protein [Candidatus Dojkabacteria bacterium]